MKTFIAFSGSLRKDSFNTNVLKAAQGLVADGTKIEIMDISTFPLFNQDEEGNYPPQVKEVKDKVLAADGIIFATPEYNRSVPGVLKNAIDWISRPYGTNPFAGKPTLIMSASGGSISGALANYHLKQIMLYLDANILGQPEFFLSGAQDKFDASGKLTDESTKEHIKKALEALNAR
jgi:chromate reductase